MSWIYLIIALEEDRYQRERLDGKAELLRRQPFPGFGDVHLEVSWKKEVRCGAS